MGPNSNIVLCTIVMSMYLHIQSNSTRCTSNCSLVDSLSVIIVLDVSNQTINELPYLAHRLLRKP